MILKQQNHIVFTLEIGNVIFSTGKCPEDGRDGLWE